MIRPVLSSRSFRMVDQTAFAQASGDWNPIHMDQMVARRSVAGAVVVHGVHLVFWALDGLCRHRWPDGDAATLRRIDARFHSPVVLDQIVSLELESETADMAVCLIRDGESILAKIKVSFAEARTLPARAAAARPPREACRVRDLDALNDFAIEMPVSAALPDLRHLAPRALACLGGDCLAVLAVLTRVVGMDCPGLHSLMSGIKLDFGDEYAGDHLRMAVTRVDDRFGLISLSVEGCGAKGGVEVFFRPPPVPPLAMTDARSLVGPDAFAGISALVVGGGRGLGEAAAKLLAAGGAEVVLTYRHGRDEAEAVVAAIAGAGGRGRTVCFDVLDPQPGFDALAAQGIRPDLLAYFATPRITAQKGAGLRHDLFDHFVAYYVHAFTRLYQHCRSLTPVELRVLVPSSVFVADPPKGMAEYAAAKAAAEVVAASLAQSDPTSRFLVERFPRLWTDQTNQIGQMMPPPPAQPMADALLRLCQR